MNANVRRAMDLAIQIADTKTKIEHLVKRLNELQDEASSLIGGKKVAPSTPPRATSGKSLPKMIGRKTPSKDQRYSVPRENYGKGGYAIPRILDLFSDSKARTIRECMDHFGVKRQSIQSALSKLVEVGVLKRVKKGVYQAKSKKAISDHKSYLKTKSTKLKPRGYWTSLLDLVMPLNKQISFKEILKQGKIENIDKATCNAAIAFLAKKGYIEYVDKGVYIKRKKFLKDDGNQAQSLPESTNEKTKKKKSIKNFEVKKLSNEQIEFFQKLKPDSLCFKIMRVMNPGKEYSLKDISGKIDPNKGSTSYRAALNALVNMKIIKNPKLGTYIRQ